MNVPGEAQVVLQGGRIINHYNADAMCSAETNACGHQICDDGSKQMASLGPPLPELLNDSVARSKANKYKGNFAQLTRWAEEQHVQALPAKAIHAALYLTKLKRNADSTAPVSATVYAIGRKYQVSG